MRVLRPRLHLARTGQVGAAERRLLRRRVELLIYGGCNALNFRGEDFVDPVWGQNGRLGVLAINECRDGIASPLDRTLHTHEELSSFRR